MFGMNFWTYVHTPRLDLRRANFISTRAAGFLLGAMVWLASHDASAYPNDPAPRVRSALESATIEWSEAFTAQDRRYPAPRVMLTRHPRHHPERAAGYYRGLAVAIDLGEIEDIEALFPRESETLTALVVAHEVAHHVQFLNIRDGRPAASSAPAHELEADCAAGWWLGRANARHLATTGAARFSTEGLERQLPRLFQALYTLHHRRLDAPPRVMTRLHGADGERIAAVQRGLEAADPALCGAGVAP